MNLTDAVGQDWRPRPPKPSRVPPLLVIAEFVACPKALDAVHRLSENILRRGTDMALF